MRLLLIAVPLSWVLVYWWQVRVEGVWWAMLLGSAVTAVVAAVWLRSGLRRAERGSLGDSVSGGAAVEPPVEAAPAG
jgi:Na+-driven multidrug efflux pump